MLIGKRYEVIRTFEGGMGLAHVCKDLADPGQLVVLKTYKEGATDQEFRASLVREANAWIALHGQQYLARIDDVLTLDGKLYLKMPYYSNGNLADVLKDGPLPIGDAVRIAAQLLMGMRYLSDKENFLHLDLKPQNVLIGESKEALITDLGLAKCVYKVNGIPSLGQQQRPKQSGISGTIPYMAPELFKGGKATVGADVWAWGLIVIEMLTGRNPFTGSTLEDLVIKICTKTPSDFPKLNGIIPRSLYSVLGKCIEKDPSRRFQSFAQLSDAFDKIIKTGVSDEKLHFWKSDDRILIIDKATAFHWESEVRQGRGGVKASIKFVELTEFTRAKRYRSMGDRSSALASLKNILGDDKAWASQWAQMMKDRSSGSIHLVSRELGFDVYLGRQSLVQVAEFRLAVFLDGIYAGLRISEQEIESYCKAALQLAESGFQSPKLLELCGQLFLHFQEYDLAEEYLLKAWESGTGQVKISTAACLATLYGKKGELEKLRDFSENEIEPRFADLDDAKAQETCARPYLFLKDSERALHFLRRSLGLEMNNPWGIMQACIAAWNCGQQSEAKRWRQALSKIAPDSPFQSQIDRAIPALIS